MKRVVLPRVLSVEEITAINREIDIETEVFAFGGLCVMAEWRCSLSSCATDKSPDVHGVCSPAGHVAYADEDDGRVARLGGYTIQKSAPGQPAPYPTLCKGQFSAGRVTGHLFEDPVSLDATDLLPRLAEAGVTSLKIEGRQRSRAYVSAVVTEFRRAVDALAAGRAISPSVLATLREGQAGTAGAYRKTWR